MEPCETSDKSSSYVPEDEGHEITAVQTSPRESTENSTVLADDLRYRCFQTSESAFAVLAWLSSPEVLYVYGCSKMPQCFQGRAWFAAIFEPEQRGRIYGLVADDGNGCWKDKDRRFGHGKKLDDETASKEESWPW
ncbi:hypothetical protein RvY_18724 [Ramazzottius varieornatus]|uniref:Uncharacterized protein n=1 Tax=Ramazzottius varieornatus TaxID=947166 RepID=A0A1D1W6T5_RAMVA|nr:hypothetical protein RvY_18724 [Ramazzottius varieornatus]